MRLLFVEDEPTLARQALPRLRAAGFDVDHAVDSAEALLVAEGDAFDVVAVDFGLPLQGGPRLVRGWREAGFDAPILALTAAGGWREKIDAVRVGADDALSKPFRFEDLTLRLKRLGGAPRLRRAHALAVGDIALDERSETVTVSGRAVPLENDEARVLALLMRRAGEIVTRAEIVDAALSRRRDDAPSAIDRTIQRAGGDLVSDCVNRLRRKIGDDTIQIVSDRGFRLG